MAYKTTAAAIARAERRRQALEMRAQGHTLAQIGTELGVTKQAVSLLIQSAIERSDREGVALLRAVWRERLESDFAALEAGAEGGDEDVVAVRIRIAERAAKLDGLDAPTRSEVAGTLNYIVDLGSPGHADPAP